MGVEAGHERVLGNGAARGVFGATPTWSAVAGSARVNLHFCRCRLSQLLCQLLAVGVWRRFGTRRVSSLSSFLLSRVARRQAACTVITEKPDWTYSKVDS